MKSGSFRLPATWIVMLSCIFAAFYARAETIEGTLGRLFLQNGSIRFQLFFKHRDLPALFGIHPHHHHDSPDHLKTCLENNRQILFETLRDRVRIDVAGTSLSPELKSLDALPHHYARVELVYPLPEGINRPDTVRLHYLFPANPDKSDALALAVYDRTPRKAPNRVIFLHGSRKMATWSPEALESEPVDFPERRSLNAHLLGLLPLACAILFFPYLNTFMENRLNA